MSGHLMFPQGAGGRRQWIYLVGLADGRVKVGIAARPRERVGHYVSAHAGILWSHLFPCCPRDGKRMERAAIDVLGMFGKRVGHSEYFRDLTKQQAISCVRGVYAAAMN